MPLVRASEIEPDFVHWLWPGRLAVGSLALLDGNPNLGKSYLALDLCARLSTGRPFPDGAASPGPASSIVLCTEDHAGQVVRPRLAALGADLSRVHIWKPVQGEAFPCLPSNAAALQQMLKQTGAVLMVIDPIVAFLDPRTSVASEQDVRQALGPLADLAQNYGCCALMQRHLNKQSGAPALYRGLHSIGFNAVCRSCWVVGADPDAPGRSVLAQHKNNYDAPQPSLSYSIINGADGATVVWHGVSPRCADELLTESPQRAIQFARACAFLIDFLKNGPRLINDGRAAARRHGLSRGTLRRAREHLEISTRRLSPGTPQHQAYWLLPDQELPTGLRDPLEEELEGTWKKLRAQAAEISGTRHAAPA